MRVGGASRARFKAGTTRPSSPRFIPDAVGEPGTVGGLPLRPLPFLDSLDLELCLCVRCLLDDLSLGFRFFTGGLGTSLLELLDPSGASFLDLHHKE